MKSSLRGGSGSTFSFAGLTCLLIAWGCLGAVHVTDVQAAVFNYGAVFTGTQEVPANASTAIGSGQFTIDTNANTVTYRISFTGLSSAETAAHIHGPAAPGVNAGVLQALALGNPKVGVWNYAEAQEPDLLAGRMYANIHSATFAGGEIRGQIVSHNAQLDGAQETPPSGSASKGFAVCVIDTVANTFSFYIAYAALPSGETAAHIHGFALHGTPAGVLFALPAGNPKVGVWNYAQAQEAQILAGQTYVNIHSNAFPGGEIRGQLVPMVVPMDGAQEVPANGSTAAGLGLFAYDLATDNLSFDIRYAGLSGAETAAHIHGFAGPGVNAGVLFPLPLGTQKLGVWNFGAANQANVTAGLTYANVHSTVFAGGEIRGQITGFPPPPTVGVEDGASAPVARLLPGAPNPFQAGTRIGFELDRLTAARLTIYDIQGRLVRNLASGQFSAGVHTFQWDGSAEDGRRAANGIYRYVLHTPRGNIGGRVVLLK